MWWWGIEMYHHMRSQQGNRQFATHSDDLHHRLGWYLDATQQTPNPDNKVHGVYMGPTWGRQGPGWPHVGPMNFSIRVFYDAMVTEVTDTWGHWHMRSLTHEATDMRSLTHEVTDTWGHWHMRSLTHEVTDTWGHWHMRSLMVTEVTNTWGHWHMRSLTWGHWHMRSLTHEVTDTWGHWHMRSLMVTEVTDTWGHWPQV